MVMICHVAITFAVASHQFMRFLRWIYRAPCMPRDRIKKEIGKNEFAPQSNTTIQVSFAAPVDDMSLIVGLDELNIDVPDALNLGRELSIKRANTRKQLDAVPRSPPSHSICCSRLRRSLCDAANMLSLIT